jgi:hypothetical protein
MGRIFNPTEPPRTLDPRIPGERLRLQAMRQHPLPGAPQIPE